MNDKALAAINIIKKIKDGWKRYPFLASITVFIFIFIIYFLIYVPGSSIVIDDHFFHFKFAYLIRTEGLKAVTDFHWIPFWTSVREGQRYPLSLFQIALIPFTYIKDMFTGLKISDAFWVSLSFSLIYYVFRKSRIKYPLFFLLVLLSSNYLLMRMMLGRAFLLTLGLVFLEAYLAVNKKYLKFFWVVLFHVLWHQATFLMPVIMVAAVEGSRYVTSQKIFWRNIGAALSGIILGMLFYPGFSINFYILEVWSLLSKTGSFWQTAKPAEGAELYSKNSLSYFWGGEGVFFLLAIVGIGLVVYYYVLSKKDEAEELDEGNNLTILMYSVFVFLIVMIAGSMLISGRLFDYYVVATVFLFGILITKLLKEKKITFDTLAGKYIFYALIIFFAGSSVSSFLNSMPSSMSRSDPYPYAQVAQWVGSQSKDQDLVYLDNWSMFTPLFFYNSKNTYTIGLEPNNLLDYDKNLYWKWYNVYIYSYFCDEEKDCQDEATRYQNAYNNSSYDVQRQLDRINGEKVIEMAKNDFHAKFIITDHAKLNTDLTMNNDLIESSFESKSDTSGAIVKGFKLK